jgi:hypothetical protein
VADLDRPLIPSPGVDRHTADLRRELEELLKETASLRARVRGAAPGDGHAVDLTSFRDRVARLVEALGRYEEKEVALIQQAVCTDIGAGD